MLHVLSDQNRTPFVSPLNSCGNMTSKGFTLLELCLTLALIGTLLGLGLLRPALVKPSAIRLACQELLLEIRALKLEAEKSQQKIELEFQNLSQKILVWKNSLQKTAIRLPSSIQLVSARFGNLVSSTSRLELRPNGTSTPGSITLKDSANRSCTIKHSLRGRSMTEYAP